jgi:hypothetical protein
MLPKFETLYQKKYPPDVYRKEVQAMVRLLQQRYGVERREDARGSEAPVDSAAEPEQVGFRF